jgi:hypothetical protein
VSLQEKLCIHSLPPSASPKPKRATERCELDAPTTVGQLLAATKTDDGCPTALTSSAEGTHHTHGPPRPHRAKTWPFPHSSQLNQLVRLIRLSQSMCHKFRKPWHIVAHLDAPPGLAAQTKRRCSSSGSTSVSQQQARRGQESHHNLLINKCILIHYSARSAWCVCMTVCVRITCRTYALH